MRKAITLKEATEQIQTWRSKQKSKAPRFPDDLKSLIAQLSKRYKTCQLAKSLKISRQTLYAIKNKHAAEINNAQTTSMDFIPFRPINSAPHAAPNNCEIIKPDGTKLIICSADPVLIIKMFLCSS